MTCPSTGSRRWPARQLARPWRSPVTRRTTPSPYAASASASRSCSPTARARSATGAVAGDRQARLHGDGPAPSPSCPRPTPSVTVVQAMPKGDRGELAVEVLTEIGVDRDRPVGRRRAASRSGGASGPRSPWLAGGPPRARPPSSRAGRGSRRSPSWPRRPTSPSWSPPPTWPWCCTRPASRLAGLARGARDRLDRRRGRSRGRAHRRRAGCPSRPPARTSYGWAPRCCARRPPASPPSPPCSSRTPRWQLTCALHRRSHVRPSM